jgi:hypothetical protein
MLSGGPYNNTLALPMNQVFKANRGHEQSDRQVFPAFYNLDVLAPICHQAKLEEAAFGDRGRFRLAAPAIIL